MIRRFICVCAALVLVSLSPGPAHSAVVTDGHLDPEYGPALATQVNGYPEVVGPVDQRDRLPFRDHSASNVLHAYVSTDSVLHVFVGGVLLSWIGPSQPTSLGDRLYLLIDDQPGGQPTLLTDGGPSDGFANQAGLRFDSGFVPDYAFSMYTSDLLNPVPYAVHGFQTTLGALASTTDHLGDGTGAAPGLLGSGTNPFDVRLAIDNTDSTGVPRGCVTGSGAGVTTGVEWAIPLAAIGRPTGCIRLMAYPALLSTGLIWNQVLPPVPAGTCTVGLPSTVDFSAIAGEQFTTVCPTLVPTRGTTWGALKTRYR